MKCAGEEGRGRPVSIRCTGATESTWGRREGRGTRRAQGAAESAVGPLCLYSLECDDARGQEGGIRNVMGRESVSP